MSGVAVIWYLLKTNALVLSALGAGPPAASARIMAGDLPLKTVLPAIAVTQISSVPYNVIRVNELPKLHTDRVQVSWLFKGPHGSPGGTGYPGIRAMGRLVLRACRSQRGVINGIFCEGITPDVEGPDLFDDETALQQGSRDLIVRWVADHDALLIESMDDFLTTESGEIITEG